MAIFVASYLYLAKLTSLSPVYILLPILLFLAVVKLASTQFKLSGSCIVLLVMVLYSFTTIIISNDFAAYINLVLGAFSYVVVYAMITSSYISDKQIIKSIEKAAWVVIFIISIDTAWRLTHPGAPTDLMTNSLEAQGLFFYLYKFNTLMFADSNTVAIGLQCIFFLMFYFSKKVNVNNNILIVLALLILLTLSRASIISTLFCFLLFQYRIFRWFLSLLVPVFIIYMVNNYASIGLGDGSALSKFDIIRRFFSYLESADLINLIFGSGSGSSTSELGIYGHISFVTSVVEFGIVGTFIYLVFFISSAIKSNLRSLYVILPIAITSLSYAFYLGAAFMFIPLAIIEGLEVRKRKHSKYNVPLESCTTFPRSISAKSHVIQKNNIVSNSFDTIMKD